MPLMSAKYPQRVMHERELKEVLGLGRKLPDESLVFYLQGYRIELLTREVAKLGRRRSSKPHRLCVECKGCCQWFSAGRLAQHESKCLATGFDIGALIAAQHEAEIGNYETGTAFFDELRAKIAARTTKPKRDR